MPPAERNAQPVSTAASARCVPNRNGTNPRRARWGGLELSLRGLSLGHFIPVVDAGELSDRNGKM
jgi:hypothetical protein